MSLTLSPALMPITTRPDPIMVRGEGSYLFDDAGKRYLDFIQGWAVNALGPCPPEIVDALTTQAGTLVSPSPALHNHPQHRLAAALAHHSGLDEIHFANSGAEANEAAVKLARKWGRLHRDGAHEIITTEGGFHGRTLAMMAASGKPGWDALFPPVVPGFRKVRFGDAGAMRAAITDRTVALMVEPIQGEGGVVVPAPGYLRALRSLADEHGLLLIFDEVQTGMGRTGRLFAFEHEDARPDVMTLGKGLGGGVPISAMLATRHACCFEPGDQGGTYNGNPLMCAVAEAIVEVVAEPAFLARVREAGARLRAGLEAMAPSRGIAEIRGSGLLWALRLAGPTAGEVCAHAMANGLLVNPVRPDTVRLMPSLRVTGAEIDAALAGLDAALSAVG